MATAIIRGSFLLPGVLALQDELSRETANAAAGNVTR